LKTPHGRRCIDRPYVDRQTLCNEYRSWILGHFLHRKPTAASLAVKCVATLLKQNIMTLSNEVSLIAFHLLFVTSLEFHKNGAIYSALEIRFFARERSHRLGRIAFTHLSTRRLNVFDGRKRLTNASVIAARHDVINASEATRQRLRLSAIRATCTSSVSDRQLICRDLHYGRPYEKLGVANWLSVQVVR
jgi:hypothetical protein